MQTYLMLHGCTQREEKTKDGKHQSSQFYLEREKSYENNYVEIIF